MGYSQAKRAALYALRRRLKALVGVVRGLGSSCEAAVIATARSLLARMTTTECEVFTSSEDGERPPWLTDEAFKECWRTGLLPEVVAVPPPAAEEHDIHDAALKVKVRDEYVAQRRRVLSTVVRAEHPDMERTAQRAEVVKRARMEFKAMGPTSLLRYLQEGWRHLRDCQGVQRSLHALAQPGRRLQAPLAGAPRGYPTRSCRLRGPLCPILSPFPGRYKLWCFYTLHNRHNANKHKPGPVIKLVVWCAWRWVRRVRKRFGGCALEVVMLGGGGLRGWGTGSWTWTGDENNVDKKRTWMRKMAAGILPFAAKLKEGTRGRSTDAAISAALAAQANQQRRRLDDKAYAKMDVDE